MSKICSNCGNPSEDHQNFCTNCGTPLAPQPPAEPEIIAAVPVVEPQPVQPAPPPPPTDQWQSAPPPPPVSDWQSAPPPSTGTWQAPPPPPAAMPGQYQPPQQPPTTPQQPIFNTQQAKAEFEESKGLFLDMLNAHKADATPSTTTGDIPQRKYPALKLFMSIYRIVAWIIAGSVLLSGVVTFFVRTFTRYWWQGLLALPISVLIAFIVLASVYAIIDIVRLFINIEDNTRRAANK